MEAEGVIDNEWLRAAEFFQLHHGGALNDIQGYREGSGDDPGSDAEAKLVG